MGIMSNIRQTRKALANDTEGIAPIIYLLVIAGISLAGTYWFVSPIGEGIGEAFTIFGQSISLYVVIGLVIVALFVAWLIFGRK